MRRWGALLIAAALLTGCASSVPVPAHPAASQSAASGVRSTPQHSPSRPQRTSHRSTDPPGAYPPGAPTGPGFGRPPARGESILGRERVVADYGAPGSGALGILGRGTPEQAARAVMTRAAGYEHYGEPVLPAMELIATVARRAPGPNHSYSAPIPLPQVRSYLDVAHEHHMLLILDLQPGRASFASQARALAPVLLDPSVGLALDPEWQVGPGGRPGNGLIGHSSAAGINATTAWLSQLVRAHHLPDKLVVVHEFTSSMLPDRQRISQHPGVEMVLHADGFGHPSTKIHVLRSLHFPSPPFGVGFKLFLTQDSRLMSPREVMQLRPRPDVVTYQ